jgi:hypothetical protein
MNGITFRYLISLVKQKHLSLQLMDVMISYLYGSLDSDIYLKLNKSLYGLKKIGRIWYKRLKEFLLNKRYSKNDDCTCVFIRKSSSRFCFIFVYVDDLNIIGTEHDTQSSNDGV